MDGKPKITPTHTYVFDKDDIEQLDELSLSCVVKAIDIPHMADDADLGADDDSETSSYRLTHFDDTQLNLEDFVATATDVDMSIDKLLDASESGETEPSDSTNESDAYEILMAPEEILGTDSDDN